jgi:hypothetical protein
MLTSDIMQPCLEPSLSGDKGEWAHLGHLQEVGVYSFLYSSHTRLFPEMVRTQQAEVIIRVAMVEGQDEVYQSLPAAVYT